jgi:hypothetical protein
MSNITITFAGGFHNVAETNVRARVEHGVAYLSEGQYARLQRTFCGRRTCECGGVHRATATVPAGWRTYSFRPGAIAWSPELDARLEQIRLLALEDIA